MVFFKSVGGLTTFGSLVGFRASHGNPKPSFLEVISPIFWGVKPSFFMGTWGPREGDICNFSFWGNFQILVSDMFGRRSPVEGDVWIFLVNFFS